MRSMFTHIFSCFFFTFPLYFFSGGVPLFYLLKFKVFVLDRFYEELGKSKTMGSRTRNYACMVYLDSCNPDWLQIIEDWKVPVFISPLHDRDLNPTGEPKKPHHHVLVMFDSVKTEKQAREFFESFGGVGCEVVSSCRAYARYLCHLDNPEKVRYDISDVIQFGGSDYKTQISSMADKDKAIDEMIDFVVNNNIIAFFQLALYARENRQDWNDALKNGCSYYIKEFIKSKYWYDHL